MKEGNFKPTKAHILYGEVLRRKDLIEIDTYRINPNVRETSIKIEDKIIIMYRIDGWLPTPLVFFSDNKYKLIEDSKFVKMVEKYVRIK